MKKLFRFSKSVHKYLGLLILIFLVWESISGILLNHPELAGSLSVPCWLVPEHYQLRNWNRSSLITLQFSNNNPAIGYAAGNEGVWITRDSGKSFSPFMDGDFSKSRYFRKTKTLLLVGNDSVSNLFAGTLGGLYLCDTETGYWHKVALGDKNQKIAKIISVKDSLHVFTDSHCYISKARSKEFDFKQVNLTRKSEDYKLTLIELFFDLHGGKAWGITGKLIYDLAGIIIIFLSISAFYVWFFPKKNKIIFSHTGIITRIKRAKLMKFFFRYHSSLAIWSAIVLFIIAGTGLFLRPPLIAVLSGNIPYSYYPGFKNSNPWNEKIRNALYNKKLDRFEIDATDGYCVSGKDICKPFSEIEPPAPIFAMGATVFEQNENGELLIGSFAGIFETKSETGGIKDFISGSIPEKFSSTRPSNNMITGYFISPDGKKYINTYFKGLMSLSGEEVKYFKMPEMMGVDYRMPLWNYMFEIHNGRFFQGIIGEWYILLVPLGSLLFLLIILTGVFDWIIRKTIRLKNNKSMKTKTMNIQEMIPIEEEVFN